MKPKFIDKKAKIYLVAPSFGCTTSPYEERLEKAIKRLEKNGHTITVGPNCNLALGKAASNTKEARGQEFMDAYQSDCDLIISVGGGEMMVEMLDCVDFDLIKTLPPKWFLGFSDNTNLTFTLTTLCEVETIYGPCIGGFHYDNYKYDILDTYEMLQGKLDFKGYPKYEATPNKDDPFSSYHLDTKKVITPFNYSVPFSGTLIGGCLDCLQNLCGTPYDQMKDYANKHKEGIIFYFEACDLSVLGIKRALIQLKRAGWFQNIKGILVGRPLCGNQEFLGIDHINAVTDVLSDLNVPILLDIDLGHLAPTMPMRNGAFATVKYQNRNIFINYKK